MTPRTIATPGQPRSNGNETKRWMRIQPPARTSTTPTSSAAFRDPSLLPVQRSSGDSGLLADGRGAEGSAAVANAPGAANESGTGGSDASVVSGAADSGSSGITNSSAM